MKRSLILRLGWFGLGLLFILWLAVKIPHLDIGTLFVLVVVGGCVLGILVVKFILPRVGDAVGAFFYLSGENSGPESTSKAVASLAQGDYTGAIAEYEKLLLGNPEDTLIISEIAKLRAEKLNDPLGAVVFLETQMSSRSWSEEDGAFLLFRLVDMHEEALHDFDAALAVLERVISLFPNTRHSANAQHRMHEIHQAQSKALSQQRPSSTSDA